MMNLFSTFLILSMASLGASKRPCQRIPSNAINVIQYGAIGDGKTDDSQAFLKAWAIVCGSASNNQILYIPKDRTFLLQSVKFKGPCKSPNINVQVLGNIVAPSDIAAWTDTGHHWLVFSNVNGLIVNGNGKIDGQGLNWWQQADKLDRKRPTALVFSNCNDLQLSGLTHVDSPGIHIYMDTCNGVTIDHLHIIAPESSPNTDGIDMGHSSDVQIRDCIIGTGDDCIAIGGGSSNINISGIECGPGHGISIGSLGPNGRTDIVEEVHVRNCSFQGTTNGARIKTWQGGSGYARKISFEEITLVATANPIIIDQFYCNGHSDCKNQTSAVKVSDVSYTNFHGTSSTEEAIQFSCSQSVGCSNIVLNNVDIISTNPEKVTRSSCSDAHGRYIAANPIVDCLLQ